MYAITDDANTIIGFEKRALPLNDLAHVDYHKNYILITDDTLAIGDIYDAETKAFKVVEKAIKCDDSAPIEPPKPPLSEIELAILDTAINTQYLVILTEMGF